MGISTVTIHWRVAIALAVLSLLFQSRPLRAEVLQLNAKQFHQVIEENRNNFDYVILDIRTPKEFAQGHIAGAVLLDYYNPGFVEGLKRLDRSKSYLMYCRSGNRSSRTIKLIENMGFARVYHLHRGIIDWVENRYPLVP